MQNEPPKVPTSTQTDKQESTLSGQEQHIRFFEENIGQLTNNATISVMAACKTKVNDST